MGCIYRWYPRCRRREAPAANLPGTVAAPAVTWRGNVTLLASSAAMKIGPYELGRPLGTGTVGDAFLASAGGNKTVVVKQLRPDLAADATTADRFLDACALSSRVKSRRFLAVVVMQKRSP